MRSAGLPAVPIPHLPLAPLPGMESKPPFRRSDSNAHATNKYHRASATERYKCRACPTPSSPLNHTRWSGLLQAGARVRAAARQGRSSDFARYVGAESKPALPSTQVHLLKGWGRGVYTAQRSAVSPTNEGAFALVLHRTLFFTDFVCFCGDIGGSFFVFSVSKKKDPSCLLSRPRCASADEVISGVL